jgi:hypothetical protein
MGSSVAFVSHIGVQFTPPSRGHSRFGTAMLFSRQYFSEGALAGHDLIAWLRGPRSAAPIDNNNRKYNGRLPGPFKSLARRPSDMQSLHGRSLLMVPATKKPGAVSRPGAIPQFLFHD